MNDINMVVLTGRLTKNPEFLDKGSFQIAKFSLAVNYNYKKDNEWQTETTYVDCNAWNALAEIVNRVSTRGCLVSVEGRLVQEHWTGQDGKARNKLTLRVAKFNKIKDAPVRGEDPNQQKLDSGASATEEAPIF